MINYRADFAMRSRSSFLPTEKHFASPFEAEISPSARIALADFLLERDAFRVASAINPIAVSTRRSGAVSTDLGTLIPPYLRRTVSSRDGICDSLDKNFNGVSLGLFIDNLKCIPHNPYCQLLLASIILGLHQFVDEALYDWHVRLIEFLAGEFTTGVRDDKRGQVHVPG